MTFDIKAALAGGGAAVALVAFLAGGGVGDTVHPDVVGEVRSLASAPAPTACPNGTTELVPPPDGSPAAVADGEQPLILCDHPSWRLTAFERGWQAVSKTTGEIRTGNDPAALIR